MVASAKLSQATQERLLHLIETGDFQTADEAVTAALDALEELKKAEYLDRKLADGMASFERNGGVLHTPELSKATLDEVHRRFAAGERADPDYAFE